MSPISTQEKAPLKTERGISKRLLEKLSKQIRCDFCEHQRIRIVSRINHRFSAIRSEPHRQYSHNLDFKPEEHSPLIEELIINLTAFIKDVDPRRNWRTTHT